MPTPRLRFFALFASCVSLVAGGAGAQCPDGAPPPCRAAARPSARPANLPLDDHTWIVLPFENQARAADVDWLKDASVNLLTLDLSRWSDVRAIDDKRVADYVRDLPNAKSGARLTLTDGQDVARRAGAARLVMGEFLKVGSTTRVTAAAYDVRTGSRVRTATEQTNVADSLMSIFGKLARGLLDVPPPSGAAVGSGGTANVQALQEYLAAVKALNRFDLTGARPHFEKALQLDSAFAMAHYKFAIMIGWDTPGNAASKAHAEAAQRFSSSLPPRERGLIAGHFAFSNQDFVRARQRYEELVRADSNDVEALYGLADCLYHDTEVIAATGDTSRVMFRASWNESIRLFQRALRLDPSYHLAFAHILDAFTADLRAGCRRPAPSAPCNETFNSALRRSGDSLLTIPVSVRMGGTYSLHAEEARRTHARVRNLEQARAAALEWVAADPGEKRARAGLAHIELLLGNTGKADSLLAGLGGDGTQLERLGIARDRIEIAIKRGRGVEANRLADSAFATVPPSNANRLQFGLYFAVFGRLTMWDSVFTSLMLQQGAPASIARYFHEARRIALGAPTDSLAAVEQSLITVLAAAPACNSQCRTNNILPSLVLGLRLPRAELPAFDSTHVDWRLGPARALARKDTAALRRAAITLDSLVAGDAASGAAEDGASLTIADAWLLLRDTTRALVAVRRMLDVTFLRASAQSNSGMGSVNVGLLWPRGMLLRADLAAGVGARDEARTWYKRWLDLWSKAEPEFQPLVERVKKSYAAVGGT